MFLILSVSLCGIPGGYPNNPGSRPSEPGGLSVDDCVVVPQMKDALCFAFRTDNSGPPESVQVTPLVQDGDSCAIYAYACSTVQEET